MTREKQIRAVPVVERPKEVPVSKVEKFFRISKMKGSLVLYGVEEVTIEDDILVSRKIVTERDTKDITMSKIMIRIEGQLK